MSRSWSTTPREALFERGFQAAQATLSHVLLKYPLLAEGAYICPLCLRAFRREGLHQQPPVLTLEHVPPRTLGGKAIVLTCLSCNTRDGKINRHALARARGESFLRADMKKPLRGTLDYEGLRVSGEAMWSDGRLTWNGDPARTAPGHLTGFWDAFDASVRSGREPTEFRFSVELRECYSRRYDRVSTLRDAYLVALVVDRSSGRTRQTRRGTAAHG